MKALSLLLTFFVAIAGVRAETGRADLVRDEILPQLVLQLTERHRLAGELQLELLRPLTLPAAASGPVTLSLLESPPAAASSMIVRVRLQCTGGAPSDHTLSLRAQLFREVWATREPVERGAGVDGLVLESRRVDTLREREALPTSEGEGLTFARSVPAGRLLTWRDVSRRALVRKGQVIEVTATDGALTLSMKAMAMENGAAGETVKVRNLESRREFTALVTADSRAQVRF